MVEKTYRLSGIMYNSSLKALFTQSVEKCRKNISITI